MVKRMIDRNGHRFGAVASLIGILAAFVLRWRPIAPVMVGVFAIGVLFGLRYSPMGLTYRGLKKAFRLTIPVVPEEEPPPRFAQAMGLLFMALATLAFYGLHSPTAGWTLIMIVAVLQALLGITGICVGCEMYLIGKRMTAKASA
ncbi:MAG: DUF4395 domain-containing protein [Actinomycetota bacterium]